jgi:hypothetical protein
MGPTAIMQLYSPGLSVSTQFLDAFAVRAHVHGYIMRYRGGRIGLFEKEFRNLLHRTLRRFLLDFKS